MRVRYNELEAFLAVALAGSFRRAAADRGVTASALSQSLRNLEERMQLRLLNRTTRSISLTEAGESLLDKLTPVFSDIENAVEEVASAGGRPSGRVRINAPAPAIEHLLMPHIPEFLVRYPDISLEIIDDASFVDIVSTGYDAGIRFGLEMAKDMIAVPLGAQVVYAVVGTPDYLARYGIPQHPNDLFSHECIRHRFPGGSIFKWRFSRDGEALELTPGGRLTLNNAHYVIQCACAGSGLARLATPYIDTHISRGELVQVLRDWSPAMECWHLYYPSRRQLPPAFRAFLTFFRAATSAQTMPHAALPTE